MAQRERSDGAQRYPGEASKFVRGSSSFPGGGAGARGERRPLVALFFLFDRGRRLGSLGDAESGVGVWGGSNFQFSRAL